MHDARGPSTSENIFTHLSKLSSRNLWSQPFYYILMRFSFNNQEIT